MKASLTGVLNNRDFLKFWIGQTVSIFGSGVTFIALPLTAMYSLHASAMQMGFLRAAGEVPYLIMSLFIGVMVDRVRRKTLMVAVDLGRAVLIGIIPALTLLHLLHIYDLYIAAIAVGGLSVMFDTANQAYLPTLTGREELQKANSAIQFTFSLGQISGPAVAGLLVSLLTAPVTLLIDTVSYLVSALSLISIKKREPFIEVSPVAERKILRDISQGLKILFGHSVIRPLTLAMGGISMFFSAFLSVYFLYLGRDIGLTASDMGLVLAIGAVGATIGAIVTGRSGGKLPPGMAVIIGESFFAVGAWLVPLAGGTRWMEVVTVTVAALVAFFGGTSAFIVSTTMLQKATPDYLLGRVSAASKTFLIGLNPIGAVIGGVVGSGWGLRPTLIIGASGITIMVLWLLLSPVRSTSEKQLVDQALALSDFPDCGFDTPQF